jgi:hypothetical protein
MGINKKYGRLADNAALNKTVRALKQKGVNVYIVQNGQEAKTKMKQILPEKANVMNMTSTTLQQTGIEKEIMGSGRYKLVRRRIEALVEQKKEDEQRAAGAAPEWAVGSVHALTQTGQFLIASNTGSQLAAYAYGAKNVIWVISTKKIVKNLEDGLARINEYSLPLEDERARKVYGVGSAVNKILIINKEIRPQRITAILVKEDLGF